MVCGVAVGRPGFAEAWQLQPCGCHMHVGGAGGVSRGARLAAVWVHATPGSAACRHGLPLSMDDAWHRG